MLQGGKPARPLSHIVKSAEKETSLHEFNFRVQWGVTNTARAIKLTSN